MLKKIITRFKTLFTFLLGISTGRQSNRHILLAALAREIGFEQLEILAANTGDRRELVARAAQHLQITQSDLIKRLANRLKLPIANNVNEIEAEVFRQYDYSALQRAALIPILNNGINSGFAVADPGLAVEIMPSLSGQQFFLASWQNINQALEASYTNFQQWEQAQIEQFRTHVQQQVERVLVSIFIQAEKYSAEDVSIRILEDEINYEFRSQDGRRGKGQIHLSLKAGLVEKMNQLTILNDAQVVADAGSYNVTIQVQSPSESWKVSFTSTPGIALELPMENASPTKATPIAMPVSLANSENINLDKQIELLVIEDNPAFSKVLQCFLSKQGFSVYFATSGADALSQIAEGLNPDVIICDVHMPVMNGHELVRRFRNTASTINTPIIMLTSDNETETELQFIDYGVDAFISKSSDPRLLVGYAKRLAARSKIKPEKQVAA